MPNGSTGVVFAPAPTTASMHCDNGFAKAYRPDKYRCVLGNEWLSDPTPPTIRRSTINARLIGIVAASMCTQGRHVYDGTKVVVYNLGHPDPPSISQSPKKGTFYSYIPLPPPLSFSPASPPPLPPGPVERVQDGTIPYGSHYQDLAGRTLQEKHFRVPLSWATLELIVTDQPSTRRFAEFRPKQRYDRQALALPPLFLLR